jgi:hypothetical protein
MIEVRGTENTNTGATTRVLACLPYLLPLLDNGKDYAKFFPFQLQQVSVLFNSVPFAGLLVFIIFSLFSRDFKLPRLVRFSFQQAMYLDVALLLPALVRVLPDLPGPAFMEPMSTSAYADFLRHLLELGSDAAFIAFAAAVFYAVFTNLVTGELPNGIPYIGSEVEKQIQ